MINNLFVLDVIPDPSIRIGLVFNQKLTEL